MTLFFFLFLLKLSFTTRPWPRPFCEWLKCLRPCAQVCLYAKVEVSELRFS
ncbi:hypothetical protein ES332_A09G183700v1 [Gossypium tomentosum]|uniref:Uncharacterized protein n=1 Tax=Gossypium tomentosum TaxID=34277 RepID=A0A5D2P4L5_GOSTO|nr:hypothetical protein ES332_A09G183700v1 [Gossypium tomentosum]